MVIADIKKNHIYPFEMEDCKIMRLFSFFLHKAPTIESEGAFICDASQLDNAWTKYIEGFRKSSYAFNSHSENIQNILDQYGYIEEFKVQRRTKGFVCKLKDNQETDYECFFRHIRNSIAHCHVYISNVGNRKYILLEDYNNRGNLSARILLSQADLTRLKNHLC